MLDTKPQLCNTRGTGRGEPVNEKLQDRINKYTNHLNVLAFEQQYRWTSNAPENENKNENQLLDLAIAIYKQNQENYEFQEGKRFIKIVGKSSHDSYGSAHAFVEKETGKLAKSASWNSPAKRKNGELQSKYNLLDDNSFELLIEQADIYGGHLYVR